MDLSIIIVNWRSLDFLRACISSIHKATRDITYEIVVIDNASGDGSENVIPSEFPDVLFLGSQQNLGFAKANNLAYARSSGEILLFLNPDTEINDNVFARMVAHLRLDPSVGAAGACLLNGDHSVQTSCIRAFPTLVNQMFDSDLLRRMFPTSSLWGMAPLFSSPADPAAVEAISGACFMVKREVFEEVGHFTETYFMYGEDMDLSYKISRLGFQIHFLPNCRLMHFGGQSSSKQGLFFADLWQKESRLQFFRNTRGGLYAMCYRSTVSAAAAWHVALILLSLPLGRMAFRDKDRRLLLNKWIANLQWALGLKDCRPTEG